MAKQIDVALKVAENHTANEVGSKILARMKASTSDLGASDSLGYGILAHVTAERYDKAAEELKMYIEMKEDFPQFKERTERYVSYAIDLMNGIKAKRSFPGIDLLSMSKQQELLDRAMEHFNDLKDILIKIERIDREVRLDDIRSTVWVVKALVYCTFALLVIGFAIEISRGVLPSLYIVVDDFFGQIVNLIFDKLGL